MGINIYASDFKLPELVGIQLLALSDIATNRVFTTCVESSDTGTQTMRHFMVGVTLGHQRAYWLDLPAFPLAHL